MGSDCQVEGDSNVVFGSYNHVSGKHNVVVGDHLTVNGDYNTVNGHQLVIVGDHQTVFSGKRTSSELASDLLKNLHLTIIAALLEHPLQMEGVPAEYHRHQLRHMLQARLDDMAASEEGESGHV